MGRHAAPSPKWNDARGQWCVRITERVGEGSKPHWLPREIGEADAAAALTFARELSDRLRASQAARPGESETVADYAGRWIKARTGRVASVADNEAHLERHILPVIGSRVMAEVTAAHIEDVVAALDRKVRAGTMNSKTAKNAWGTCSKLFDDATHAKPAAGLRCLTVDPTQGVRGPDDDAADKALQFLYPSEFSTFVACEGVPLAWRRNVAVAVYLCLRDGEHRALKWPAVDLAHGVVTVAETFDRRAGADREGTKSGAARVVPIRPELLPLLEAMKAESGGKGLVCDLPSLRDMARGLRRWLLRAGVDRAQLHQGSTVSKQLRWHDLRATGLTWYAVEGRPSGEIRDIAGHAQTSMTDRYMRAAGVLRGGRFGEVFPPLPGSLLGAHKADGCPRIPVIADRFAVFAESKYAELCGADGTRRRADDAPTVATVEAQPTANQGESSPAAPGARGETHDVSHALQRPEPESFDVTSEELERAIVRAMLDGRGVVAEVLAMQLRAKQHASAGVVSLPPRITSVG
jgi:integrase